MPCPGGKAAPRLRYSIVTEPKDPCRFANGLAGLSSSGTEGLGTAPPNRRRPVPGTHRTPGVSPACARVAQAGRAPSGPNPSANSVGGREDGRTVALATLHRLSTVVRCVTPPRSRSRAPRRAVVVAAAVAGLLAGTPVVAGAAPAPLSEQASLEEQVRAIEEQVRAAEEQLQRMTVEAEAAADAALVARAQLAQGQAEAERTAAELAAAQADVAGAEEDIAELSREAYMGADNR